MLRGAVPPTGLTLSFISNFKQSIVNFGNDLLVYTKLYGLRYGFFAKMDIKDSIKNAKRKYKQFTKKYRN